MNNNRFYTAMINVHGKATYIKDARKINVICGKNNSGKSQIIESLSNEKRRTLLLDLNHDILNSLEIEKNTELKFYSLDSNRTVFSIDDNSKVSKIEIENIKNGISIIREYIDAEIKNKYIDLNNELKLQREISKYARRSGHNLKNRNSIDDLSTDDFSDNTILTILKNLRFDVKFSPVLDAKRNPIIRSSFGNFYHFTHISDPEKYLLILYQSKNSIETSGLKNSYLKVKATFKRITGGLDFDVITTENDGLDLVFKNNEHDWYTAYFSGTGLRDLLYLISCSIYLPDYVLLIEEPENHIHPKWQREFLRFLKFDIPNQVVLTTHSNIFLDTSYADSIYLTFYNSDKKAILLERVSSKAKALSHLGYLSSDNLSAQIAILVEGKTDVVVFEEFLRKFDLYENNEFVIMSLGHVNGLSDLNYEKFCTTYAYVVVIADGDLNKESIRAKKIIKKKVENILNAEFIEIDGYGIENYFSLKALNMFFENRIPDILSDYVEGDYLKLNIKIKGLYKNENNYREISQSMSVDEIKKSHDMYYKFINPISNIVLNLNEK